MLALHQTQIEPGLMGEDEARECERRIVAHVKGLRDDLARFYDGRGWVALGYGSFYSWAEAVGGKVRGINPHYLYNYIKAIFVAKELSTMVESSEIPERQLRPLTQFVSLPDSRNDGGHVEIDGDAIRDIWERANDLAERRGERMVARHVEEAARLVTIDASTGEIFEATDGRPANFTSDSNEWYTPAEYIEAARRVMGGIDLDPASNDTAQAAIQATKYYTEETNGLDKPWLGRVWLNPPYGVEAGESAAGLWAGRLIEQHRVGNTTEAVLLVNAVTDRKWFQQLWQFPICFTNHRIKFYTPEGVPQQPVNGNALVYLGPNVARFVREFSQFGTVVARLSEYDGQVFSEACEATDAI